MTALRLRSREVRQHRRTIRIVAAAVIALAALTAASVLAGVLALAARNDARRQLKVAESQALAGQARADYRAQQLDRGQLLALAAYPTSPTPEVRASLVAGLEAADHVVRFLHVPRERGLTRYARQSVRGLAFSPDGRTLAVATDGAAAGQSVIFASTSPPAAASGDHS
ncbi:MAG: hypothetical protein WBB76_08950 [Gaiellaceae bacterium]